MVPSFFKKLGPISTDLIMSVINCKTVNVTKDDFFDNFVSIINVSNNSSKVPKPPGNATKACEYLRKNTFLVKKYLQSTSSSI